MITAANLKQNILEVLDNKNAQRLVDDKCKMYIYDIIQSRYPDEAVNIKAAIECVHIPYRVKGNVFNIPLYGVILLLLTIVGCAVFNYLFQLPIIGVISGFVLGVLFINSDFCKSAISHIHRSQNKTIVERIYRYVENYIKVYEQLCEMQHKRDEEAQTLSDCDLETRYFKILNWFHSTFERIEGNDWVENDITRILNSYGYDFVKASDDNIYWFNTTPGNVNKLTTSIPALINKSTNRCIIKGHAIKPL